MGLWPGRVAAALPWVTAGIVVITHPWTLLLGISWALYRWRQQVESAIALLFGLFR